jgi:hypothetical protein
MEQTSHRKSRKSDAAGAHVEHLLLSAAAVLSPTRDWLEKASVSNWHPSEEGLINHYHLVLRSIILKQAEALDSILILAKGERGFSAVPLLRAMYEELIWVLYLASRTEDEASRIVLALGAVGIFETFLAQENYVVPNTGFSVPWKLRSKVAHDRGRDELRAIFSACGFTLKKHQTVPSMAQLAKSVSMETTYGFLYHGTSRAVHFSVPEQLRRIWGNPGQMTISSNTFEAYWAAFSLYWGSWLYSLTFLTTVPLLQAPDLPDENLEQLGRAMEAVKKDGAIPILTNEEVYWPETWR